MLSKDRIIEIIVQPDEHIDEMIKNVDDIINSVVDGKVHGEPEIHLIVLSHALLRRIVESHFSQWKILIAQLSQIEMDIESERRKALYLLSRRVLKSLIASLENLLDYEKNAYSYDKSWVHDDFTYSQYCKEAEA